MSDAAEIEKLKARITALERILRVDAIQATGDAVDQWWHLVHDEEDSTPEQIDEAGKEAAKEVLNTKNKERHRIFSAGTGHRS